MPISYYLYNSPVSYGIITYARRIFVLYKKIYGPDGQLGDVRHYLYTAFTNWDLLTLTCNEMDVWFIVMYHVGLKSVLDLLKLKPVLAASICESIAQNR